MNTNFGQVTIQLEYKVDDFTCDIDSQGYATNADLFQMFIQSYVSQGFTLHTVMHIGNSYRCVFQIARQVVSGLLQ